jgi:hypothetical protein
MNRVAKALLVGLGYDGEDGHIRIARGKNFRVLGGSQETHEMILDKMLQLNKQLDKRSKTLEEVSEKEFRQIARDVGLKVRKK